MNIRIYSEERKETNIYEYEYIRLQIFEYIWMSESSLHTDMCASSSVPITITQNHIYHIQLKLIIKRLHTSILWICGHNMCKAGDRLGGEGQEDKREMGVGWQRGKGLVD